MKTMYSYYNNCVNWDARDVCCLGGLSDMVDEAKDITRRTFLKHVNKNSFSYLRHELGYAEHWRRGLTMGKDYHIQYFKSKHHGHTVYFFTHSAIEYVFKKEASAC